MTKKEKIITLVAGMIVLVLVVLTLIFTWKTPTNNKNFSVKNVQTETKKVINESSDKKALQEEMIVNTEGREVEAVVIGSGSSLISKKTGEVLTKNGDKTKNDVEPGSSEAPQSSYVINPEELPVGVVNLLISYNKIEPAKFEVSSGQAVTLALTAVDKYGHTFVFENSGLRAVAVAINGGDTKTISFNAPVEKGEYLFFDNISNYRSLGAEGKMVVK